MKSVIILFMAALAFAMAELVTLRLLTNTLVASGGAGGASWLHNANPERKKRVIAYRKQCPECEVTLTSTNVTTWVVNDETNSIRMTTVLFNCAACDENYIETFKKPIRKTKVEEVSVEVVK